MDCKWFNNDFETCTNGDCPFCADFCPVTENQEVCRYSDLDDTETMLRRCLDAEKEDSREAIQALAEENKDLKKQLEKVKAEKDTAVGAVKNMAEYIVCAGRVDYFLCDEISQEHHLKYQPKNDGNYDNGPCYECVKDWFLQGHKWQEE